MQAAAGYPRKGHLLAVLFGVMLVILLIMGFVTFAYGTYMVFNQPISDVVADTIHLSNGNVVLELDGSGFNANATRQVWIDPRFSNNSTKIDPNFCCLIGTVQTDTHGNVALQNLTISSSQLGTVESDGQTPHGVWIMGVNQPAPGQNVTFFDAQQNYTAATTGSGIILFATLITFVVPVNFTLGQLFLLLWTIFVLLFAVALNGPFRNVIGSLKQTARVGVSGLLSNSMFATFLLFPVVLWGSVLLEEAQSAGGVSTGILPATDPLLLFVELSLAPLREEIGFRVIPIGIVALLVLFSRRRIKDGVMALWHPMRYLKKNDTPAEYKRHQLLMYILIAISAALFGLAHVLLGAGWGIGKISEAAGAGVALGVLYYQYGFAATVLLHWAIDYMNTTFAFNNTLYQVVGWYELYTLVIAIGSTTVLVILLLRRIKGRNRLNPAYSSSGGLSSNLISCHELMEANRTKNYSLNPQD